MLDPRHGRVEVFPCPAVRGDRRVHRHVDGAALRDLGVPPHDLAGVTDDNRHDGHAGLHRQVEASLFEAADLRRHRPGALRRDHHRRARAQPVHGRLQCRDGLGAVRTVEKCDIRHPEQLPDHRDLRDLLLGHEGEAVAQQPAGDEQVDERALVVDEEHRGTVRPQVLLSDDLDLDVADGAGEVPEHGGGQVDAPSPVAVQDAHGQARSACRQQAAVHGRGAESRRRVQPAWPPPEVEHRPATGGGLPGQPLLRVDRMGVPDGLQERHVLVAVGVTVAGGQVDAVPGGKRLHRGDLAGTPQCPTRQPTGEDTVLGLQLGAQQVLDPEPPRQRTSLEPGGRGRDYHGVAAPLVRLGQPPRVVEQRRRNALDEQPLSQLDHVVVGPACPPSDAALHQLGRFRWRA